MTTSSEAFQERERRARILTDLGDMYAKVARHLNDGRAALAEELCQTIVAQTDTLGDDFTTTQFPPCLACAGTAEMPSPSESDRKVRCQDVPSVCKGNRFGRMHPVQMQDFMLQAGAPKHPARLDPPSVPDENLSGDMKPTPIVGATESHPSAVNVYDRDAVIAFNALRSAEESPVPVPEDDEEVLAHADGTYTVRKKG
jgi:hypothetical protein